VASGCESDRKPDIDYSQEKKEMSREKWVLAIIMQHHGYHHESDLQGIVM
jgi:hypothetical protein